MSVTLGIIAAVVFTLFFVLLFTKLLADRKLAGKMINTRDVEEFKDTTIQLGVACLIALVIIAFSFKTYAADGDERKEKGIVSEKMPEYPGGEKALVHYLSGIEYPVLAKTNDIQGIVKVKFIINDKGEITKVNLIEGVNRHLNKAAIARIKQMPNWSPGINKLGEPVSVQLIVPVSFVLE